MNIQVSSCPNLTLLLCYFINPGIFFFWDSSAPWTSNFQGFCCCSWPVRLQSKAPPPTQLKPSCHCKMATAAAVCGHSIQSRKLRRDFFLSFFSTNQKHAAAFKFKAVFRKADRCQCTVSTWEGRAGPWCKKDCSDGHEWVERFSQWVQCSAQHVLASHATLVPPHFSLYSLPSSLSSTNVAPSPHCLIHVCYMAGPSLCGWRLWKKVHSVCVCVCLRNVALLNHWHHLETREGTG